MSQEPQKSNTLIIIAIIGVIGTVIAAVITVLGNYNVEKLRQETELTRIASASIQTQSPSNASQAPTKEFTIVLSDQFDGSNGSYDTNLWTCLNGCNMDNLFLQDGVLNLKSNRELTDILSRSEWDYRKLASLSGKIQMRKSLYQGETSWVWISLHNLTSCTLVGSESPFISCSVTTGTTGDVLEYSTNNIPINFDSWYMIKIEFDHNTNSIKFYLDNTLIGEYVFTNFPDTAQVSLGAFSLASVQAFIDDVRLTLNK